ncbi:hypothetical protein Btru_077884 [Bulinus truncatus]|nr:hypothetical protein Btru_077884 [Bulinus truncatus]
MKTCLLTLLSCILLCVLIGQTGGEENKTGKNQTTSDTQCSKSGEECNSYCCNGLKCLDDGKCGRERRIVVLQPEITRKEDKINKKENKTEEIKQEKN